MNWKNIKNFLILLFLCIDVYLLIITYQSGNAKELTDANIYDTVMLLERNGIAIDNSIIPKNAPEYKNIELTTISFADKSSVKTDENGLITITSENAEINEQNAYGVIRDILKNSGLDTKNIIVEKKQDGYFVTETVDGMRIYNNSLRVTVDNENVTLKGTWYGYHISDNYKTAETKPVYATSALIAFIGEFAGSNEIAISEISFGYHAVTDQSTSNAKSISAAPCYCLTDSNGKSYYYNILDTSFVE